MNWSSFARRRRIPEGLKPENIAPFAGSSDPLHRITLAFKHRLSEVW